MSATLNGDESNDALFRANRRKTIQPQRRLTAKSVSELRGFAQYPAQGMGGPNHIDDAHVKYAIRPAFT
jgi:hypothetical protein